jgi:hypothetical protein
MRKMSVHCTELPSSNGNCLIFDECEEDMLEMPSSLSALATIARPDEPQDNMLERWELSVVGHMSGYVDFFK